jgi:hypothetical protein
MNQTSSQFIPVADCRISMIGLRSTFFPSTPELLFVHSHIVLGVMSQYLGAAIGKVNLLKPLTISQFISLMFQNLSPKMNKDLVSLCCAGKFCKGDEYSNKAVYEFVPGLRTDQEVIIWLRLGRIDMFVDEIDPPSNDALHFDVIETLAI